jgi:hypothetical protein
MNLTQILLVMIITVSLGKLGNICLENSIDKIFYFIPTAVLIVALVLFFLKKNQKGG